MPPRPGLPPVPAGAGLRPPRHRVNPKARYMWTLTSLWGGLILVVPLCLVAWFFEGSRPWSTGLAALAVLVMVGVVAISPQWRYRVHRWEVDDQAIYTRTGWIHQEGRVVPLNRIQTVDSSFGVVERCFGLGSLNITTASSTGTISVEGLDRDLVEELVLRLTTVIAQDNSDAT